MEHWTAEGKTDAQLAPRQIDGEWYLHVSDTHNALAERDAARRALAGANDEIDYLTQQNDRFRQELGLPVEGGQ
jgi:hypothetical protein